VRELPALDRPNHDAGAAGPTEATSRSRGHASALDVASLVAALTAWATDPSQPPPLITLQSDLAAASHAAGDE
jgi:hypothetical protein